MCFAAVEIGQWTPNSSARLDRVGYSPLLGAIAFIFHTPYLSSFLLNRCRRLYVLVPLTWLPFLSISLALISVNASSSPLFGYKFLGWSGSAKLSVGITLLMDSAQIYLHTVGKQGKITEIGLSLSIIHSLFSILWDTNLFHIRMKPVSFRNMYILFIYKCITKLLYFFRENRKSHFMSTKTSFSPKQPLAQ